MEINIIAYPKDYLDIIYLAGKNCYGQTDNIEKTDIKNKFLFTKKIIRLGHESLLEHINICLFIKGVSRSLMAQLTRHRHVSFSIKSQHFINHSDFKYKLLETDKMIDEYKKHMKQTDELYKEMVKKGIPHYIARDILPNSCLTDIFMTCNIRELRYIIKLRNGPENTPEIRILSSKLLEIGKLEFRPLFDDIILR